MDKAASHKIVRETFEGVFDKDRFIYFCKNLLNTFDTSHASSAAIPIPSAYKDFISRYERIGTYTDPTNHQLDLLVVYLQRGTSLERARTAQRNFVARYLKEQGQRDAGLVAFVSPSSTDWRFSLVKMDYKFAETKGGRVKVEEEFTPARRWSFLVGESENSHTAKSQLSPVVQEDEANPTLAELEDAFNIEKVTDEFFEKYRDLFLQTNETLNGIIDKSPVAKAEFAGKHVRTADFSKQLLGQIIFLYFLQKKGWFGVGRDAMWGSGPKNFIRQLFEGKHGSYKNFFNDILEPLFYEALARERDDDYYARFNCKIPFLNGGLFDPVNDYDWIHADILLPDGLFSNSNKTPEGDTGNGILDVFDRYNFTVKEDEPLEREVAVDPEMLGKVFENLLEVKDRKSKGTYYTPREIVHYMCQQSLIHYLVTELDGAVPRKDIDQLIMGGEAIEDIVEGRVQHSGLADGLKRALPERVRESAAQIDEALADIKICDPAIGSGAFPVGMMSEIVRARCILSPHIGSSKRTSYNFKRHCIQNCLYGVDIDPGAVDIAKLRLWLSLVVDEDDIKQIKPLPNLDYKIMQGNSLLEEFEGVQPFDEKMLGPTSVYNDALIAELKERQTELQREYFALHSQGLLTPVKQAQLQSALGGIADQLKSLSKTKSPTATNSKLFDVYSEASRKATELKQLHKEFFEATQKRRKEAIKQRIAALEWELIEATLKEEGKSSELKRLEGLRQTDTRPFFLWKLHFADVFEEKGGFDVVIANPPYVSAWSMEKQDAKARGEVKNALKDYSILTGHWDLYIAFIAKGHNILRGNGGLAYIVPNPILREKYAADTRKFLLATMTLQSILEFNDVNVFDKVARRTSVIVALKMTTKADYTIGIFSNDRDRNTISLSNSVNRDSWLGQPRSIFLLKGNDAEDELTGKIEKQSTKIGNFFYVNYGIQVSSKEKGKFGKKDVVGDKPKGQARLFYEGKDVHRWRVNCRKLWLDYRARELYGPRAPELFENDKIVLRKVSDRGHKLAAALDTSGRYTDDGNVVLVPYRVVQDTDLRSDFKGYEILEAELDLKYVLAVILSRVESYYFGKRFATESLQGATSHTYPSSVRALVVKNISKKEQEPFIKLVDDILAIAGSQDFEISPDKQSKVEMLERQLDRIVYELYGLGPDEVKIVEGRQSSTSA